MPSETLEASRWILALDLGPDGVYAIYGKICENKMSSRACK